MNLRIFTTAVLSFIFSLNGFTQTSYYRMPVLVEDKYQPSELFVSCPKLISVNQSLKNYSGNDSGIIKIKELINEVRNVDSNSFKNNSVKDDTLVMMCFSIYSLFIPKVDDPILVSYAIFGNYRLYFVKLRTGFPLISISLLKNASGYWNNPIFAQHPAVIALTLSVNHNNNDLVNYSEVDLDTSGYRRISFDTIMNHSLNGTLAIYMNLQKVNFLTTDTKDSANVFPANLKNVLNYYRNSLTTLKNGTPASYFNLMTDQSKARMVESIQKSTTDGIAYYKDYITQYVHVAYVINCGKVKFLLSDFRPTIKTNLYHTTEIIEDVKTQIVNENNHYYFNDILNTKEVLDALKN